MSLLTENPWPLIVPCLIAAAGLFLVWRERLQKMYLIAAVSAVALAGLAFVIDRLVVTDAEHLEQDIRDLALAFRNKDRDRTLSYFSDQANLKLLIETAMNLVDVHDDLDIKDVQVTMLAGRTRASTRFRANGTVSYMKTGAGHQPSRWDVKWQREGFGWKIIEVRRLHLINDEELAMFGSN
jgi:hypothetical protein